MTTGPARPARRRFTMDDLFSDTSLRAEGVTDLDEAKRIRLDRIIPDPEQPRRSMDPARLEELASAIRAEGVLVPIEVTYDADRNVYIIVHGERRWRAAQAAGLAEIPAMVRELDGNHRVVRQLMENLQREDLNAVDRARGFRAIKEAMGGVAWEQVADAVGIKRSRLFQLLDIEKLPETIQDDIRAGRLSEKHGRALKDLEDAQQTELRDVVVAEGLSGDETLRAARTLRAAPALPVRDAVERARSRPSQRPALPAAPQAAAPTLAPVDAPSSDDAAAPWNAGSAAAELSAPESALLHTASASSELSLDMAGIQNSEDEAAALPPPAPAPAPGSYASVLAALAAVQNELNSVDGAALEYLELGVMRRRITELLDLIQAVNLRLGRAQAIADARLLGRPAPRP
ncbi:MAG: ParB/RepB/Spo0J family partition protein [Chloroflexi bacterium]|nr:ParB/RepB/Spo0J family partition protein [Chloroflexota bacterium]